MAPAAAAAAACSFMAHKKSQSQAAVTEVAFGARMATLRPVTLKGLGRAKSALTVDVSCNVEEEGVADDVRCETPKASEHRVPDVDVDFCPPAPKKARAQGRFALICAIESENWLSRSYLF